MKKHFYLFVTIIGILFFSSCSKTESGLSAPVSETITISSNTLTAATGSPVSFFVNSSVGNNDVTSQSKVFVNDVLITGNSYTFSQEGSYAVYATKGIIKSNVISIEVTQVDQGAGFVSKVLVEEYSGTWCGNCPKILYGVDLVKQQTDKAIIVSAHLFNADPYITTQGNTLAENLGISGVPAGRINRTIDWIGPQYENVSQVINQIQASASAGLAISSTVTGGNLSVMIKVGYTQALTGNAKLTVYLVEDKLIYTQRNYSANLYGGLPNISNFEYNGVIRAVVSSLSGDAIPSSGSSNEKAYLLALPANIANISNVRLVAFVTNANGMVVNVQEAGAGLIKDFERL